MSESGGIVNSTTITYELVKAAHCWLRTYYSVTSAVGTVASFIIVTRGDGKGSDLPGGPLAPSPVPSNTLLLNPKQNAWKKQMK